ncbi:helix-turn-helix domain-containing protein [Youhaiella tibetensis]|uniref:Helix-turn-helix domain-containing protein n=2 Tax=Paradevosia tibetensis TaxID=1447062 RepID=A0A5B9DUC9_9HYPH|nr:helix-turn-helix domain-containing protein [Youhaiella tibetensis]
MVGIAEAARIMGIGRSKLYTEISEARLKVRKAGKRTLIAVADIEAWCRDLPNTGDV